MCESNLSEDLMSFEVLPHNGHGPDSLSSEYSLIPEGGDVSLLNTELDFSSQDLSMVEIQQKILELANDNAAMKDALERNNSMMKEQLNTISEWHGQITTSMSHQQLSLKESQERCEQLLKENQELKEKIKETQVKTLMNDMATEVPSLTSKQEHSEDDSVAKALIDANETIAELKIKLDDQESTMLAQYQSAQDKIEKSEIEVKSLQQENSDLRFLVHEKDKEIEDLKMLLNNKEIEMLREQNTARTESLKHAETRKLLNILQAKYDRTIKEHEEKLTDDWHRQSDDQQRLLVQVDSLTAQMLEMQDKLTEKEDQVVVLTHQLEALNKDSEAIPVLKSQLEVFKLDLERARESKKTVDEEVQRLNQVVGDMQTRLNASAPPAEEGARASTRGKNISFKSVKKLKESKRFENPLLASFPSIPSKTIPRTGLFHNPYTDDVFVCPICNLGFTNAQAVENHANQCLDNAQPH